MCLRNITLVPPTFLRGSFYKHVFTRDSFCRLPHHCFISYGGFLRTISVQGLYESRCYEAKCRLFPSFTFFMVLPDLREAALDPVVWGWIVLRFGRGYKLMKQWNIYIAPLQNCNRIKHLREKILFHSGETMWNKWNKRLPCLAPMIVRGIKKAPKGLDKAKKNPQGASTLRGKRDGLG